MDVCIAMQDAELVGELLQALHILDTPHSHPAMQKGYHFLLGAEKQGKMRGNWVQTSASFYQKYHAAYTGIIGLAEFKFDPNSSVAFLPHVTASGCKGTSDYSESVHLRLTIAFACDLCVRFLCVCSHFPKEWAQYFK
jgi:hypothetical protein